MLGHLEPIWKQGLKTLDASKEIECMVANRAQEVMVMFAALGLVPHAPAQNLHRRKRSFFNASAESAVNRGKADAGAAQAAPQLPGG